MARQEHKYRWGDSMSKQSILEKEPFCRIAPLLHKGTQNGVHLRELKKYTGIEERNIRKAIEQMRRAGMVILSNAKNGYYFPINSEELAAYIRKEERRAKSTFYTLKSAKKLYKELEK